jgi:tartrate-resistant acid phosphatase type 5
MPYSHKPVRLLMLGDTGNFFEPLRRMVRREAQRPTSTRADAVCLLGDNFYPGGITRGGLKHFLETFQPLAQVPRLMLLGNHDYCHDARIFLNSPHWTMPDYSYALDIGPVSLIMIDTCQIEPSWVKGRGGTGRPGDSWTTKERVMAATGVPQGVLRKRELERLDAFLASRKDKFTIVCGHYPLVSNGLYDMNEDIRNAIVPILEKHKANAYVAGHEHSLEHTQLRLNGGHVLDHMISGASSEARPMSIKRFPGWVHAGLGSLAVEADGESVQFIFTDPAGKELYRFARKGA